MLAMVQDDWPSIPYIIGLGAGMGPDALPEAVARYMRAAASPSAVYAYEVMNGQIDTRPILPTIQAPTLVMNHTARETFALVSTLRATGMNSLGASWLVHFLFLLWLWDTTGFIRRRHYCFRRGMGRSASEDRDE